VQPTDGAERFACAVRNRPAVWLRAEWPTVHGHSSRWWEAKQMCYIIDSIIKNQMQIQAQLTTRNQLDDTNIIAHNDHDGIEINQARWSEQGTQRRGFTSDKKPVTYAPLLMCR
jgi:hypothetical protein